MGYYGWGHGGVPWGAWIGFGILAVLLVAGIVAAAVLFSRTAYRNPPPPPPQPAGDPALQVLNERFARGEIDEEEYVRRRGLLLGR